MNLFQKLFFLLFSCCIFQVSYSQSQIAPISATASNVFSNAYGPGLAIDGNDQTFWSSGVDAFYAPSIEINFGVEKQLSSISLKANQFPAGFATHVITGRRANGTTESLGIISQQIEDGQIINFPISTLTPFQFVRIQTTSSSSWPAWYEIKFFELENQVTTGSISANSERCLIQSGNQICSSLILTAA